MIGEECGSNTSRGPFEDSLMSSYVKLLLLKTANDLCDPSRVKSEIENYREK